MRELTQKELLEAGVHFGHLKRKWNPKMLPYIFMEKKGIHIIDLNKTNDKLQEAANAIKNIAQSGRKILFVATKKQAQEIVEECAKKVNMPFVTERWLGGMLTNYSTIRKSIKKMQAIDKLLNDPTAENITKKERLVLSREKDKLERVLGGIANLVRIPTAIFVVDISTEHIAISESKKLNLTTFAMVDTNSDPSLVDYPIPANDDSTKSIKLITHYITDAILEGLKEREADKNAAAAEEEAAEEEERQAAAAVDEDDTEESGDGETPAKAGLRKRRRTGKEGTSEKK
ncbi:MAG: 30S ribosomal protein S2 [Chitinophagaceae bacterium]|jgi:small subunit ribosomal protein S2|nr:MAG: 30S ribosomal protein S2 [Chitinophagaceae bacterium]